MDINKAFRLFDIGLCSRKGRFSRFFTISAWRTDGTNFTELP